MTRRAFLKSTGLSLLVLTLAPGWIFGRPVPDSKKPIHLPDYRKDTHPVENEGEWRYVWVKMIKARSLTMEDGIRVGEIVWVAMLDDGHPADAFDQEYLVCDGRELSAEFPELAHVLQEHPHGLNS